MTLTDFSIGRILVFTFAYSLIGAIFPTQGKTTIPYLSGVVITGFLYALLLQSAVARIHVGRIGCVLSVWIAVYIIQFLNPLIEGYFFTNLSENIPLLIGGILFGAMLAAVYAMLARFLFGPEKATSSAVNELKNYFGQKKAPSWIWRILLAALSWPLFYLIFGATVAPAVTPYYTDPNLGYNLTLLNLEVILLVQALRGFIYVGALLPLIALLRVEVKHLLLTVFGFLYIGGSIAIFVIVETFPAVLRIAHGFGDLLAASLMFSIVIAYLFTRRVSKSTHVKPGWN